MTEPTPDQPIDAPPPDATGVPFTIPVVLLEGVVTSDGREIAAGGGAARALPITLHGMAETSHGGMAGGAVAVGRIETLERYDASALVDPVRGEAYGTGVWAWRATGHFRDDEVGLEYAQLAADQVVRGVSVDLGVTADEIEVTEVDEDGWPLDGVWRALEWEIMAATQVTIPAFAGAYIVVDPADIPGAQPAADQPADAPADTVTSSAAAVDPAGLRTTRMRPCGTCTDPAALVAAGATPDDAPPAGWFTDPALTGPTPLTVGADGRVFGHLAVWGTCHTAIGDTCVTPPRSATEYAYFHTGALTADDGATVAVGRITVGTGHADTRLGMQPAVEHYDNTGTCAAYVRAGEDAYGIWCAGTVAPGSDDATRRLLAAHPLSGDWRRIGGTLELIGALCVNVPGFPIARVAAGEPQALVAAGAAPLARARVDPAADHIRAAVDAALGPVMREFTAAQALARMARRRRSAT
jgi:hypothetical protein